MSRREKLLAGATIQPPLVHINDWSDLPRAIALSQQVGSIGLTYLLQALHNGRIAFQTLLPNTPRQQFRAFTRATDGCPAVVLIGDDDGADRGPAGWPMAHRAIRWASAITVHASGAELRHYETVVQAAELTGKSLLIECSTATAEQWIAAIQGLPNPPPTLLIWPQEGVHPIAPRVLQ